MPRFLNRLSVFPLTAIKPDGWLGVSDIESDLNIRDTEETDSN